MGGKNKEKKIRKRRCEVKAGGEEKAIRRSREGDKKKKR